MKSSETGPPSGPVVVSVHGCRSEADLGLALGSALGVRPVGAAGALRARLAEPELRLVVRGLGLGSERREALAQLLGGVAWRAAGPDEVEAGQDLDLEGFPAGLPGQLGPGRVETASGRVAQVEARAGRGATPSSPRSRAAARERLAGVLAVAEGRPSPRGLAWPDLLALDILGEQSRGEGERAAAVAAAVRLRVRWGQPSVAQQRLDSLRTRGLDSAAAVLLDRARAVLAQHLGHRLRWRRAIGAAEARAQSLGSAAIAGVAMERAIAHLCWWQEPDQAGAQFARAQLHWRDVAHRAGRAEALCGEAWALLAQGQQAQARVRVVEAQATGAAVPGLAAVCTQLGVPVAGDGAELPPEGADPLALMHAGQALRRDEPERARACAHAALAAYREVFQAPGVADSQRILGDICAVEGKAGAADAWYRASLASLAAVHDRAGVETTVRHALQALTGPPRRAWQGIAERMDAAGGGDTGPLVAR